MKNAFGIITAIIIMVAVASVATIILMLSSTRVKKATDDYMRIQAELLADSAIEYAIMRIGAFDRGNGGCLEAINISAKPYEANVTIKYFTTQALVGCGSNFITNLSDTDANGTVQLDVIVTKLVSPINQETITVHKRSIQRP